ncbi:MAG: radical SAM protein [Methanomassiliicoccus sp.]|nr:radical SAM protein [Methanomassiliicoccus sp.]
MDALVFGPVPSRRFGSSLGVNPVPFKTCNYSCVYCQLGSSTSLRTERREYYPTSQVVEEIRAALEAINGQVDFVTFMGEGEPTLASNLGDMMRGVSEFWEGGISLITNGSLFSRPEVRVDAMAFDVISPTVSAGDEVTFRRLHRPHRKFTFSRTLEGLVDLRRTFQGEIWAEVMLVRGINDSQQSLDNIRDAIRLIGADRTYITVPTRPPADGRISAPEPEVLRRALDSLPGAVDMTGPEAGTFEARSGDPIDHLLAIVANHPLREDQVVGILSSRYSERDVADVVKMLVDEKKLERKQYGRTFFYISPPAVGC